jgi:LPS export ABC transporter protein LptC
MSSHTEKADRPDPVVPPDLGPWTRLAPWFSRLAAVLGLGLVGAFLWQAGVFNALMPRPPAVPPRIDNPGESTSEGARLTGFDKDNHPYWIAAEKGRQDPARRDIIYLTKITAQFASKAGEQYDVSADGGYYDRRDASLNLRGNVHILQGKRFDARMPQATVMIAQKSLQTERAVVVTMATGEIRSEGLQITHDGNHILFFNGVHAIFGGTPTSGGQSP